MKPEKRIKLTVQEALRAVQIDFEQYPVQHDLYSLVVDQAGVPVSRLPESGMEAKHFAIRVLKDITLDPHEVAALCSRVFETTTFVLGRGEEAFIEVATGMDDFECTRCGRCCRLDYTRECTAKDIEIWRRLGRRDILEWVEVRTGEDGEEQYRIWKRPGTSLYAEVCPWLKRHTEGTAFICSIHDVKPSVCRSYPGLKKHGRMTGCKGILP